VKASTRAGTQGTLSVRPLVRLTLTSPNSPPFMLLAAQQRTKQDDEELP
jgi:hypothetical protein